MNMKKVNVLVTGGNSEIGVNLISTLHGDGFNIDCTFRHDNDRFKIIQPYLNRSFKVDFSSKKSIEDWLFLLPESYYDVVIFIHGTMEPIGKLGDVFYEDWLSCQQVNFNSIIQAMNYFLCSSKLKTKFITLAGGGVNGAPDMFNAYTSSKVALVKMNELLANDYPEHDFINIGPGWVRTPIHSQTISSENASLSSKIETERRIKENDFIPMSQVIETLIHFVKSSEKSYSGRNFSVSSGEVFDSDLLEKLRSDSHLFKLRRKLVDL